MPTAREIACTACGRTALARIEPVYAGFRKVGEEVVCTACGHRYAGREAAPFAAAADRQITLLIWTAILIIAGLAVLVLIIARYLTRQARLTRLKNDLIATVSHELKTPLASVRVLVDTLIENRCGDANQTREYLEIIARENLRLSRLMDNFLTFSRMERNKRAFASIEVNPAQVVTDAVEAVRERYEAGGFTLNVEVAPDLPKVIGDPDALVTVLVNLLDNAYKYSRERKQVTVKAATDNGTLVLSVEDQGIGLARRELKRVFSRIGVVSARRMKAGSMSLTPSSAIRSLTVTRSPA